MTYLGIYADESRSTWCANGAAPYGIDMWVYAILTESGVYEYNFDISFPSNVLVAGMSLNRNYDRPSQCLPGFCDPPPGLYGSFEICMGGRFSPLWLVHAELSVVSAEPGTVEIVPTPWNKLYPERLIVTRCSGLTESPRILTKLFVNYSPAAPECSGMATAASTWGAIKELYR